MMMMPKYPYNHKVTNAVKYVLLLCLFTFLPLSVSAQSDACTWMKKGEWAHGFKKAKAHKSLNIDESKRQASDTRLYAGSQRGRLGKQSARKTQHGKPSQEN